MTPHTNANGWPCVGRYIGLLDDNGNCDDHRVVLCNPRVLDYISWNEPHFTQGE